MGCRSTCSYDDTAVILFKPLYQIPSVIQRLYRGVVWRKQPQGVQPSGKVVYLTFDDGCIPEVTPKVLDILGHYGVKATFFCVGDNVSKYPDLFRRIVAEGHAVGNHTFHHLAGWRTRSADYTADVANADRCMAATIGQGWHYPTLFRPPYGRMRSSQKRALRRTHKIVLWDVLTHDYNHRYSTEKILSIVRRYSRNGSIVVFHDSLKSADRMLPALPKAIEYWLSAGYTLSTLS